MNKIDNDLSINRKFQMFQILLALIFVIIAILRMKFSGFSLWDNYDNGCAPSDAFAEGIELFLEAIGHWSLSNTNRFPTEHYYVLYIMLQVQRFILNYASRLVHPVRTFFYPIRPL